MVERLLELKDTLVDIAHPDVCLSEAQWDKVKDLECLLLLPFVFSKHLQTADLTPGAFYKEWKKLIFKFTRVGGDIAKAMKKSMEKREKILLDNDVLLAAVFVDPMHRVALTNDLQERRRKALVAIALGMKAYEQKSSRTIEVDESQNLSHDELSTSGSDIKDFEKHLDQQAKRRRSETEKAADQSSPLQQFKINLINALPDIEMFDRTSKLTVMTAIPCYPMILQKAAYAVTALPPTQVTVERLFSSLRIIRSDLRTLMKEDLLEAILFLRTNGF